MDRVSVWEDERVLEVGAVMVAQPWECTPYRSAGHLQWFKW